MEKLKNKMATEPILVFLDWKKEFHVQVDASSLTLGLCASKREGFSMVYVLQKF